MGEKEFLQLEEADKRGYGRVEKAEFRGWSKGRGNGGVR